MATYSGKSIRGSYSEILLKIKESIMSSSKSAEVFPIESIDYSAVNGWSEFYSNKVKGKK